MSGTLISVAEKMCTKCCDVKPLSEFNQRADSKDGFRGNCKPCGNDRGRRWRASNVDKARASSKRWFDKNRERKLSQNRAWRDANADRYREIGRAWNADNVARRTAYSAIDRGKRRAAKFGGQHIDHTADQFLAKLAYYGNKCWICDGPHQHADHLKPLAARGPNCLANWRPLCSDCNHRKGEMWPTPEPGENVADLVREMCADIRDYKNRTERYRRKRAS